MGSWMVFVRAHAGAWAVSMLMVVAVPGIAAASDGDARTILILSSEDSLHPFGHVTTDTIVGKLNDSISADLTIRTEFMESSQTPDGPDEDAIASRLAAKYSDEKFDLVFATGPQALSLFVHKKESSVPGHARHFLGHQERQSDAAGDGRKLGRRDHRLQCRQHRQACPGSSTGSQAPGARHGRVRIRPDLAWPRARGPCGQ